MCSSARASRFAAASALAAGIALVVLAAYGCGTDAVGIDACRQIESATCEAAPTCKGDPDSFEIETEEQVENCKTLYNDHCLLGLENATEEDPAEEKVQKCVKAIEATAKCQEARTATMAECTDVPMEEGGGALTPCQALREVELMTACAFIAKPPKEDEDDGGDTTAAATTSGAGGGAGGGGG
jgi:hypothetical protein